MSTREVLCLCGHPAHRFACPKCPCEYFEPAERPPTGPASANFLLPFAGFLGILLIAHKISPAAVTIVKYAFVAWVLVVIAQFFYSLIRHPFWTFGWIVFVVATLAFMRWASHQGIPLPIGVRLFTEPLEQLQTAREQTLQVRKRRLEVYASQLKATEEQRRALEGFITDCDNQMELAILNKDRPKIESLVLCVPLKIRPLVREDQKPALAEIEKALKQWREQKFSPRTKK